jgi:hypothetical protein
LAVRAWHFFATSTVIADALFVIDPTAMQINATSALQRFGLTNMVYLLALLKAVKFLTPRLREGKILRFYRLDLSVASVLLTLNWGNLELSRNSCRRDAAEVLEVHSGLHARSSIPEPTTPRAPYISRFVPWGLEG